jgi:uncharacterized membrane protein YfcA
LSLAWLLGAVVILAAHFVFGLAGFGVGLVAMAFLPFIMSPAQAIVLMTVYAMIFAVVLFVPLRRDVTPSAIAGLVVGSLLGTPVGVWILAVASASVLSRLIGAMLVIVVVLELAGRLPRRLEGRGWGLAAGILAGLIGGAVGLPGPPTIIYATTQGWIPRTFKANLQAFFIVNQSVTVAGYWVAGLLTAEVMRLTASYFAPASIGIVVGMALFNRVDAARFRRIVFVLLLGAGLLLLVGG